MKSLSDTPSYWDNTRLIKSLIYLFLCITPLSCILQLYFIKREYSHTHISTLKVAQISYNPVSPLRAVKSYC